MNGVPKAEFATFLQVAPFVHGLLPQGMKNSQLGPVKVDRQVQLHNRTKRQKKWKKIFLLIIITVNSNLAELKKN